MGGQVALRKLPELMWLQRFTAISSLPVFRLLCPFTGPCCLLPEVTTAWPKHEL